MKFKIELVMAIDLKKLEVMLDTLFSDEAIEEKFWDWYVARNKSASTAKPNVSGELPSDEECKCIKYKGGNKWYSNGCKIHPDE